MEILTICIPLISRYCLRIEVRTSKDSSASFLEIIDYLLTERKILCITIATRHLELYRINLRKH